MDVIERVERGELICPECNSDEVYYENPVSGSGKYTCQDCEFMGELNEFNYSISAKDKAEILRLAKIGQQMQWVPVSERLPEDNQICDFMNKEGDRIIDVRFKRATNSIYSVLTGRFLTGINHATYWRPSVNDKTLPGLPGESK